MTQTRRSTGLLVAGVVLILTSACGAFSSGSGAVLDGREFWSTQMLVDGAEQPLVPETQLRITFNDGNLGASAGCNSMGGHYDIDDGVLSVSDLAMTEIGCDPARHQQDDLLAGLLQASPTIEVEGAELRLASETIDLVLIDRTVADPDRPIIGTTWTVTGFVDPVAATSFNVDRPANLTISRNGSMTGFDGCVPFSANVEFSDGSVGGPVEGDAELQFGPIERDEDSDCPHPEYARAFDQIFATNDATIEINGGNLTMVNRDGVGATFTADDG